MSKLLNNFGDLFIAILEIIIGIIALFRPLEFINVILNCCGIVLIVLGLITGIQYFTSSMEEGMLKQSLFKGLITIILGIFLVAEKSWLISVLPIVSFIYAVIILVGGIRKIQIGADLKRLGHKYWYIALIEAVISVALALIIFKNPFALATTLWIFVGISTIVEGIFNIVIFFMRKRV